MNLTLVDVLVFGVPAAFLAIWLVGDLVIKFAVRKTPGNADYPTITRRIQTLSSTYIAIPFMGGLIMGLICGHLFGQF